MKLRYAIPLLMFAAVATAAEGPYNEAADAKLDIQQALVQAAQAKVPVLVVFGANWCGDCKVLDIAMKTGASAPLIAKDFRVVKVDVGRMNKNVDIADGYGVPLKKGIPAIAIVSPKNEVMFATRGGELADARKMGDTGIHDYLKLAAASVAPKK